MAKIKNKKRKLADAVHGRKEQLQSKKVLNPFEIHVNNEKMKVLGRKNKNDRGLPGVSRAKAINKRKHTLLQEYKVQNKANRFMDKRIGERSKEMSVDEKVMARYTAVRVKAQNKKSIFNLADDEVLTHKGQTLSEIEKFDDPRSDDEDSLEEGKSGKLEKSFVEDAHFGGGVLQKTGREGAKTHKELIEQLIAESKKRKAEKQQMKEATLELTEKLDTEWKDLMPLVSKSGKKEEEDSKPKVDDYDKVMRELRFEARGTVSDRLKTEDEVAKEEKERLEKLERERLERMKGFVEETTPKATHRSADDLDDDFVIEEDEEPESLLTYNEKGESNIEIDAQINGKAVGENDENQDEEQEEESGSESEELETESEDDLLDLKAHDSESEEELTTEADAGKDDLVNKERDDKIKMDLLKRKEIMEAARKELPFTFQLPDSYESLEKTLENHPPHNQSIIIERMIKCNHQSLSEKNKENLGLLFAYLLQYVNDIASDVTNADSLSRSFKICSELTPHLFDLSQINQANVHNSFVEVIKEKFGDYSKKPKQYPGLEVLVFFKFVSLLFSTSDFRHQVVTPTFVFIECMLNKCRVRTRKDISYGLFLVTLTLEFTTLSKRILPAAINYLGGILHMAIPKSTVKLIKVLPPFSPINTYLALTDKYTADISTKMEISDLINGEIDDEFKVRTIFTTIKLLDEFCDNFKHLPSNVEIFEPIRKYLQLLPKDLYPVLLQKSIVELENKLDKQKSERKLSYITMQSQKPKALRLYEPKIEVVYEGKRRKVQSKEKAERDKMLHKLKKETKGALREIRRDNTFLARVKIQQQIQSDKQRRDKVKRIFSEAAIQQSELNALDRKKKRK